MKNASGKEGGSTIFLEENVLENDFIVALGAESLAVSELETSENSILCPSVIT